LEYYRKLELGEIDYFIETLEYSTYNPDLKKCNSLSEYAGKTILDIKSPEESMGENNLRKEIMKSL